MYISAEVIAHPDVTTCSHIEEVALLVIDPRPDVPNSERCRLALEALFARDERVKHGHYRTITLAPFSTRNPAHVNLLRRGLEPDSETDWLILTPEDVDHLLLGS